jgi:ankyrin repeat protein
LHWAADGVQKDMALLLLDNGASIQAVTEPCKESALYLAIHQPITIMVIKSIGITRRKSADLLWSSSSWTGVLDVMTKDSKGNTPLHTFFASGFETPNAGVLDTILAMLQSLIEKGADLKGRHQET